MYTTRDITLVTRNIDCSNITVEQFISAMFSDFLEAEEKYNDLYVPEWETSKVKSFERHMKWARERAIKFAEKKWKTEKRRNLYITKEVENARKNYNWPTFYYSLSFFDFDCNPGDNGLSGNCCISYRELTPRALERCFDEVKDNKYFKKAHGWMLTYNACEGSYQNNSRPQIKLIVDSETEAQMKKDAQDLADSIREFYKDCHYWGD